MKRRDSLQTVRSLQACSLPCLNFCFLYSVCFNRQADAKAPSIYAALFYFSSLFPQLIQRLLRRFAQFIHRLFHRAAS